MFLLTNNIQGDIFLLICIS